MIYNQNNLNCLKVTSKNYTRPELACVFFKEDKTVATDGYTLVEMSTPLGFTTKDYAIVNGKRAMRGCKPFLADRESLKSIKLHKNAPMPVLSTFSISHRDEKKIEFMLPGTPAIQEGKTVDGKFPDYERVFPQGNPVVEITLNVDYLKNVIEVMGALNSQVTFKVFGSELPVVLECSTQNQYARGMVMPIKK